MFFCGSYSYLKENLERVVRKAYRENPLSRLTFVVHTNQMKKYLKSYLSERLDILYNAEFFTLIDISKRITDVEPIQDFDKEIILKKALYENGYSLDGLAEDFNLLLQQIKEYEIDRETIKVDWIKNVIDEYEKLKDSRFYDREDVHRLALSVDTDFKTDYLFIFGIKSVPPLHQKLFKRLKELANHLYVFVPFIFDSGYYQNYDHFKDVRHFYESLTTFPEVEKVEDKNVFVGASIYKFEYDLPEVKNENIRIVQAGSEYEEVEAVTKEIISLIKKGADWSDIGVVIPDVERYLPFIKEIFNRYRVPYYLIEENRYIDEPIYKKLFSIFEIKLRNFSKDSVLPVLSKRLLGFDVQDLEERIILLPVTEGFEDWERFFSMDENQFFKLLSRLNQIPDKGRFRDYTEIFKDINDEFIKDEEAKRFLDDILVSIEENELYSEIFYEMDYEEFVSVLKTFFLQENRENRPEGNTLTVLSPTSAEGNNFRYIFFLNLNSGVFPSVLNSGLFNFSSKIDYPYHIQMQELLNFSSLFDKGKVIYLSFITKSLDGSEKLPSVFLEEVRRILYPEIYYGEKKEPVYSIDHSFKTVKELYIENAVYLADVDEKLSKIRETIYREYTKDDFVFDFVELKFPISPTDFQVYSVCPYRFFYEKIIGISQIEEQDRRFISPLKLGTLIHEILKDFYLSVESYDRKLLKRNYKTIEDWFYRGKGDLEGIESLLEYLLPSYRPFEKKRADVLFERLIGFIEKDLKRLRSENKRVVKELLEKEFEDELFRGRIDRVDVDTFENYYIYDYKTGKNAGENIEREILNKYVQLIVYKRFLENEKKRVKEVGILSINDSSGSNIYTLRSLSEAERGLNKLIEELKSLLFFPKENEDCKYCPFEYFCEKDRFRG